MNETTTAIAPGDKGTPQTGQSLLSGVSLPAAAIFAPALSHNLAWMQRFAGSHGAHLAPHGKTTMTPALFRRQMEAGAWGITLATATQCQAAFAHGAERLLLANQLVGEANMAIVARWLLLSHRGGAIAHSSGRKRGQVHVFGRPPFAKRVLSPKNGPVPLGRERFVRIRS